MSEYVTTPRTSLPRGTNSGVYVSGTTGERIPRGGYTSGGNKNVPVANQFLYCKPGVQVRYYTEQSGGKVYQGERQKDIPVRNGGELVGNATGAVSTDGSRVQVRWENAYRMGVEATLSPFNNLLQSLTRKNVTENVTSWVEKNSVTWEFEPIASGTSDPRNQTPTVTPSTTTAGTGGNEMVTLAAVGVAGALLLTPKKRKR